MSLLGMMPKSGFIFCSILFILHTCFALFNDGDRILLENVKVITLEQNRLTAGRRGPGVPQLKCVGGSAGCSAFTPTVVQCRNMGSDGFDVQWECKTEMDDSYRFGKIQVSCEGYDYPNDPYILKGSCGLEYTIDYTESGKQKSYYAGSNYNSYVGKHSSFGGSWIPFILIVGIVGFIIYKMSSSNTQPQPPPRPHDHRGPHHDPRGSPHSSPPPYGFKREYTDTRAPPPSYDHATGGADSATYGAYGTRTHTAHHVRNGRGGPGFWGGMGLGGLAGYLLGSRNNHGGYYNRGYGYNNYGSNYGGGFSSGYGPNWNSGSGVRSRGNGSTSRTTSGFGGTSRR